MPGAENEAVEKAAAAAISLREGTVSYRVVKLCARCARKVEREGPAGT